MQVIFVDLTGMTFVICRASGIFISFLKVISLIDLDLSILVQ